MKGEIVALIQDFFHGRSTLKHINNTFLMLIPKSREASIVTNFRPIIGVNTINKVIAKLLAN